MHYFFINEQMVYQRHENKISIHQDITYFCKGEFYLINISLFVHTNTAILIKYIEIHYYSDTKIVRVFYSSYVNNGQ